ncbi:hypothetical protein SAY86_018542 [Trapa natans]|uniref:Uncharacterized protein n=1 Tax=Trapa natans TaxID=22666 RepID=A0AAN7QY59_TRANT|nr:hypothetical protein SAY86_018542 [Trapa natans]
MVIWKWCRRVTGCRKEEADRIIDRKLTSVPEDEAMHLFFVAMLCVQDNSVERPTMREVVQMLSEFERMDHSASASQTRRPCNKDCVKDQEQFPDSKQQDLLV